MKPSKIGLMLLITSFALLGILALVKVNVDQRGAFLCEVVAASPNLSMEDCPAHEDNTSWLLVAAFGIAFLILGGGVYFLFVSHENSGGSEIMLQQSKRKEVDFSKLSEEEQKVCAILKEQQGTLYQSDLVKKTGFSKVQITRILDRMEAGGIIERRRRGMTNMVILRQD